MFDNTWVFSPLALFCFVKSLDMDEKCINNVGFIRSEVCKRANRNLVYASGNKRKKNENDAENVACCCVRKFETVGSMPFSIQYPMSVWCYFISDLFPD